jgi:predicted outer membrane protein
MTTGRLGLRPARRLAFLLAGLIAGLLLAPGTALAAPAVPVQLSATDVALLNGVRQAGLWEMPAGQMAAEKGKLPKVREIGAEIARQHVTLDQLAVDTANKLGAQLPPDPTAEQKGWLTEMQNASGDQFDRIFVARLRAAHGKIFPVIGAVRAGTRDPNVRKLAQDATIFVMNHMAMLESTGLVRYTDLPPAAVPAAAPNDAFSMARANAASLPGGVSSTVVWVVLLAAVATGGIATFRMLRR